MKEEKRSQIEEQLVAQAATFLQVEDSSSKVIGKMPLPLDSLEDSYTHTDSETYSFESMLRLHLYRLVGGHTQTEVVTRLENWPFLKQRLGFDTVPTQATLSYTERKRFSRDLRSLLGKVADDIKQAAHAESKYITDVTTENINASPDEVEDSETPLHHYVDDHAPDLISDALNAISPAFDTGRRHNRVHEDRTVWEHQILMSLTSRGATQAAYRTFNKFRGNALHHDTHVRAVKKLGKPPSYQYTFDDFVAGKRLIPRWRHIADTIQPQFTAAVDNMLDMIRGSDVFTEPVVAAIDTIRVPVSVTPFKGEDDVEPDDTRVVVDSKTGETRVPKDDYSEMINGREGKPWAYEYATLTIVGRNDPIILAVEPIRHSSNWEGESGETVSWAETVDRLMMQATELVDIHLVMADREFDRHGVLHVLDQYHDVDYLMPKRKDSKALKQEVDVVQYDPLLKSRVRPADLHLRDETPYIDTDRDDTVGEDNYSHDVNFMYVPAKSETEDWIHEEWRDVKYTVFVTNRDDVPAVDAPGLVDRYSSRWDIEIEYKMIKPLLPSIASKDYRMRYFSFVFTCLLYNLWRLTDHSLKVLASEAYDDYGRFPFDERLDPVISMPDFLVSSLVVMFLDKDPPPD